MNVEDRIKRTLKTMFETNAIDRDKYNTYVHKINCWIERIDRLEKENEELKNKISELESELAAKENSARRKYDLVGLAPIEVANVLINAQGEYERNSVGKKIFGTDKGRYNLFDIPELRQIAEHLLVYCNYNSEEE